MSEELIKIKNRAEQVLLNNLYEVELNGILYRRTVPSKEFYIHQWNWDSAIHAMGLVHINEQRAFDEIRSLVSGQWDNGLIAQITFNPKEKKYFPGPEFWGTERFARGEILTSGITQPPLLATSVNYVYQTATDRPAAENFVNEVLPAVIKYHWYLKKYRDPENSGLLSIVHPWESGTDNSPRWDSALKRIKIEEIPEEVKIIVNKYRSDDKIGDTKCRPKLEDYYRYMYLVWLFKNWGWDYEKILKDSPFVVKDILFNSLWCRSNEALAEILKLVGQETEAQVYYKWAEQTRRALKSCWDENNEVFTDLDVAFGKKISIRENNVATFVPLWAAVANKENLPILLNKLTDPNQFWSKCPIPAVALNSPKFELTRYWRGPAWSITNLFVIEGLSRYQENKKCLKLRNILIEKTLQMIAENGFFEYFDPIHSKTRPGRKNDSALGFGSFSWTAAIFLYLFHEYKDGVILTY